MTRRAFVGIVGIPVLLVTGCGSSGKGTSKAENGPIAVNFTNSTTGGVYRRNPDGAMIRLTTNARDFYPTWSHDGTRIVFERPFGNQGLTHLFVMKGDGSDLRQVGNVAAFGPASWGPRDEEIVFADGKSISTVKPDGTGRRALYTGEASDPAWSPGGQTIVFKSTQDLLAMHADGSGVHPFVRASPSSRKHLYTLSSPIWASDGKRIAFLQTDILGIAVPAKPATTIQTANADGSGRRAVSKMLFQPAEGAGLTWAPDGTMIAFADRQGSSFGIWVVPSVGGKRSRLLSGLYSQPSWGPAGA